MQREKSNEEKLKCNGKKGDIMPGYISLKDVVKTYKVGDNSINACDGVSLDIDKGPDLRHFKIKYNSINRRNAVFFCQIS